MAQVYVDAARTVRPLADNEGSVTIYALVDPRTSEVRYIGKTKNPRSRFLSHLRDPNHYRKGRWIRSLRDLGLTPSFVTLEIVGDDEWQEAEQRWIAHYRAAGSDLTNHCDGGYGLHNPDEETRARISKVLAKRWSSPEGRARMLAALQSSVRRQRISDALTGRKKDTAHVAKLPQNQPGRRLTPDHRAKISEALKGNQYAVGSTNRSNTGRKLSPEHRANIGDGVRGIKRSDETKERMRQARLAYWQRRREAE